MLKSLACSRLTCQLCSFGGLDKMEDLLQSLLILLSLHWRLHTRSVSLLSANKSQTRTNVRYIVSSRFLKLMYISLR